MRNKYFIYIYIALSQYCSLEGITLNEALYGIGKYFSEEGLIAVTDMTVTVTDMTVI